MLKIIKIVITEEYKFKYFIFSIISGMLLALSFERFNVFIFAWVSFVPLIYCIYKNNFKFSLLYGFITGITYSVISINWMFFFLFENTKSFTDSAIVAVLMWLYLSSYFCIWAGLVNCVKKLNKILIILFIPSLWVVFEYVRNYFLSGFPINILGYSQYSFLPAIQFADVFGVYGISFIIMAVNILIFYFMHDKNKKYLITVIIVILSLLLYGFVRINQFSETKNENEINIGIAQPNIAQYKKWKRNLKDEIINTIYTTAQYFKDKNCDIILYPETVLPRMLEEHKEVQNLVKDISKYSKLNLIGGKSVENKKMYNTMFLVSSDGTIVNKYKKHHLVLFGEYVPFEGFLSKLFEKINLSDNFTKAENIETYKFGKHTLGINICSENYYPYLSRKLVLKGADILTTHSNDAWCDGLFYPYQHFVLNVFRAVENRKYLAVSANTGIAGIISTNGKIIKKTNNQEQTCFIEKIYGSNYITIYDKIGDFLIFISVIYVFSIFIFLKLKKL